MIPSDLGCSLLIINIEILCLSVFEDPGPVAEATTDCPFRTLSKLVEAVKISIFASNGKGLHRQIERQLPPRSSSWVD